MSSSLFPPLVVVKPSQLREDPGDSHRDNPFNRAWLNLQMKAAFGPDFDLDKEYEEALAEHKKQRRMEIDIEIAALLKERGSL